MNKQEWRGRPPRKEPPGFSPWWILLLAVSAVMVAAGLWQMISRWFQDSAARRAAEELRVVYQAGEIQTMPPGGTAAAGTATADGAAAGAAQANGSADGQAELTAAGAVQTDGSTAGQAEPTAAGAVQTDEAAAGQTGQVAAGTAPADETTAGRPEPTRTPVPRMAEIPYPENPYGMISDAFRALQKENSDIIGWLTVGTMIDEPVVQRDNVFYMDHDVRGQPNINGTIFLDEMVSLKTRPYGLILYGHNMRSGAMFAGLRNYEDAAFYRQNPYLTFNTGYEDGRYVIFSVGTVNVEDESAANFLDFFGLMTRNIHERERAIETLKAVSVHPVTVDVRADDQLLMLVTCTGADSERRVLTARRLREGE